MVANAEDPTPQIPLIDPTANVLKLVEEAVRRMDDIRAMQKEFTEKMIQAEVKRLDDLREVQVKRLEDRLHDHKLFNDSTWDQQQKFSKAIFDERELRLQQKFESIDKAIEKRDAATEKRFDAVSEFKETLAVQQRTLMPRQEYENAHNSLTQMLGAIDKRIDKSESMKQGAGIIWAYIIGAAGLITGLITFLMKTFG